MIAASCPSKGTPRCDTHLWRGCRDVTPPFISERATGETAGDGVGIERRTASRQSMSGAGGRSYPNPHGSSRRPATRRGIWKKAPKRPKGDAREPLEFVAMGLIAEHAGSLTIDPSCAAPDLSRADATRLIIRGSRPQSMYKVRGPDDVGVGSEAVPRSDSHTAVFPFGSIPRTHPMWSEDRRIANSLQRRSVQFRRV